MKNINLFYAFYTAKRFLFCTNITIDIVSIHLIDYNEGEFEYIILWFT